MDFAVQGDKRLAMSLLRVLEDRKASGALVYIGKSMASRSREETSADLKGQLCLIPTDPSYPSSRKAIVRTFVAKRCFKEVNFGNTADF